MTNNCKNITWEKCHDFKHWQPEAEADETRKSLEARINLLTIAGDQAIKQRNEAMAEYMRTRSALRDACAQIVASGPFCPLDAEAKDWPEVCRGKDCRGNGKGDGTSCWIRYFLRNKDKEAPH